MDCYNEQKRKKYFDLVFSKAVQQRFLPFKMEGKITELFDEVLHKKKIVEENMQFYKDNIKHLRYLEEKFDDDVHGWECDLDINFKNRYLRNWTTLVKGIDLFSRDKEQFKERCKLLHEKFKDYNKMIEANKDLNNPFGRFEVKEEYVS